MNKFELYPHNLFARRVSISTVTLDFSSNWIRFDWLQDSFTSKKTYCLGRKHAMKRILNLRFVKKEKNSCESILLTTN